MKITNQQTAPVLWLLFLVFLPFTGHGQGLEAYEKAELVHQADILKYRILYPAGFDENQQYPMVLFLHGAGERGDNNSSQLTHGAGLFLENREEFPAVVVFPQAPKEDYWAKVDVNREVIPFEFDFKNQEEPTQAMNMVMKLMDSLSQQAFVDSQRIYVGGLSMGGMGTFELLSRRPQMFAAAFAICGGANPAIASKYPYGFNIWIFHGEKDDVVVPEYSKAMAREINSQGGNAKLSLYPEANHNSWDSAFKEPNLLPWLFSNEKNK